MGTESVPLKMRPIYDQIVGLTDAFCRTHLNDEYAGDGSGLDPAEPDP